MTLSHRSRRSGALLGAIGTGVAALALAAAPADASLTFHSSVTPTLVTFPGEQEIAYRLEISNTGTQPVAEFAVRLEVPVYGDVASGRSAEGSPISLKEVQATDGLVVRERTDIFGYAPCSPSGGRAAVPGPHGYEAHNVELELALPDGLTGALIATYQTGLSAPWPSTPHIPRALLLRGPDMQDGAPVEIQPPAYRFSGRTGVRIDLRLGKLAASPGERVRIRGSTRPRVRRQRLRLRVLRPDARRLRTLAVVRTDRRGRFRYADWRPRRRGTHEVWAFYRTQSPRLTDDWACPYRLQVGDE